MNINKRTGIPLYAIGIILILVAGFVGYKLHQPEPVAEEIQTGYSEANVVDVIGTKASPHAYTAESANARATTTGTIFVGSDVNVLDFNIHTVNASSSAIASIFYVEQSNDADCATTTADGIAGISWVDAATITTTAKTATTTYSYTPTASSTGTTLKLTDWNALCAKFTLGTASTTVWVSASKQSLNK